MIEIINTLLSPLERFIQSHIRKIGIILIIISFVSLPFVLIPSFQRDTGSVSFYVLLTILFLPVLARVFSLSLAQTLMPLRKELGILMGTLAWVHGANFILQDPTYIQDPTFWWQNGFVSYLALGIVALAIATPLLLTSSNFAIRLLGKRWKTLHKTVYILAIVTILHVVLIEWSKRKSIDYATLSILVIYFVGKIMEWR